MSDGQTSWGPMQLNRDAAQATTEALQQADFNVELRTPNLPFLAPEGEAKDLIKRAKEEDAEPVWRGDAFILLSDSSQLVAAVEFCRDQLGFRQLYDLTACDPAVADQSLWLIYGLRNLQSKARLVLQLHTAKDAAAAPSLALVHPAADWHEREAAEMFGIEFTGHPDPRRLLLPDDWAGHPLRKDYEFPTEYNGISCE